jgi:hypothetical protein
MTDLVELKQSQLYSEELSTRDDKQYFRWFQAFCRHRLTAASMPFDGAVDRVKAG